jgi:hypothetical protein
MKTKTITFSTMTIALAIAIIGGLAVAPVTVEARENFNKDGDGFSGGSSRGTGGYGIHVELGTPENPSYEETGGNGGNDGGTVGGAGRHVTCDTSGCEQVGGSGQHQK